MTPPTRPTATPWFFSLGVLCLGGSFLRADPKTPTYVDDVVPVFRQHCTGCHGPDKQRGGLDVSTYSALKLGGSSGEVVVPGDPDKSRLFTLTAHTEEPKMPPKADRIEQAKIDLLKLWIDQGGRENSGSKVVVKPKVDLALKATSVGKPDGPPPMPTFGRLPLEPVVVARRPNAVLALAASPWAPLVAVGGQRQVLLYHADTCELLGVLPFDGQINSVKFSRNGKLLLAAGGRGGASGKAVLYEIETGKTITEVGSAETDAILDADLSPDQSMIAVGTPTKAVRVYATADGSVLFTMKKHTDWVTAVAFSPDGVLLATGDRSSGLVVWEAVTAREFYTLTGPKAMITDLSWRPDSNVLASASEDGSVFLWDMQTGNGLKNWTAHGGGTQSVRYAMDGNIATTGRDKQTKLWDGNGVAKKQFDAFPDLGLRVTVTHDSAKVVGGDWSGLVRVWSAADGKLVGLLDANPPALAERVKQAEAELATASAKAKQAADALAGGQARVDQAKAVVDAARKDVAASANALAEARKAVPVARSVRDNADAAVEKAQKSVQSKTLEHVQLMKAALKAKAEATDEKQTAAAKSMADSVDKLGADVETARKTLTDAMTALKSANDGYAAATKAVPMAERAAQDAPKKLPSLEKAVEDAAKAVPLLKTAADAAAAELATARQRVDRLKAVTVAKN